MAHSCNRRTLDSGSALHSMQLDRDILALSKDMIVGTCGECNFILYYEILK